MNIRNVVKAVGGVIKKVDPKIAGMGVTLLHLGIQWVSGILDDQRMERIIDDKVHKAFQDLNKGDQ